MHVLFLIKEKKERKKEKKERKERKKERKNERMYYFWIIMNYYSYY